MANKELRATLTVNDRFTSTLNKFSSSLLKVDKDFLKLAQRVNNTFNSIDKSMQKLSQNQSKVSSDMAKSMEKMGQVAQASSNKINKALGQKANTDFIKQIEKQLQLIEAQAQKTKTSINNIANGRGTTTNIDNILNRINNGNNNNSNIDTTNMLSKVFNLSSLTSMLNGNFGSVITKLGGIGVGIKAVEIIGKQISKAVDFSFNAINTATGNMLSLDGIKQALEDSMTFETGRMSLDLFYGDEKGQEIYQIATKVARDTFASESETIDIMSKMGMLGVTLDEKQLTSLIDVAGTRTTMPTEHIGLALKNAIEGNIQMLKNYGISNTTLQNYLKGLKKTDPTKYKKLKKAYKGESVGDRQTYADLVTDYIQHSQFNNFAKTYQATVKGSLDRLNGIAEIIKSKIVGMDTETGKPIKNGLYDQFQKSINSLSDFLESSSFTENLDKMAIALGNMVSPIFEGFQAILEKTNWKEVAESFAKVGELVGKFLKGVADSGIINTLAEKLPAIVEYTLKLKTIELAFKHPVATATLGIASAFNSDKQSINNNNPYAKNYTGNGEKSFGNWWKGLYNTFYDKFDLGSLGMEKAELTPQSIGVGSDSIKEKVNKEFSETSNNTNNINNSSTNNNNTNNINNSSTNNSTNTTIYNSNTTKTPVQQSFNFTINNNGNKVDENKLATIVMGKFANAINRTSINSYK